ncbi:MAG TPA: L,D-transpeptidase [Nocardioidaceae bacterium]|nr:L,D-transpeptidase [Nocardioidaceae bacterium]
MPRQRATATGVRPRYSRIAAAVTSVLTVSVALGGALGLLPTTHPAAQAAAGGAADASALAALAAAPAAAPVGGSARASLPLRPGDGASRSRAGREPSSVAPSASTALPSDSGSGRRIVFDISDQRVWLVRAHDRVARTYPVSGSVTDNLPPGEYEVYSKSRDAIGVDDSGTMKYMVRFAHGEHAAIGFHDIPILDGERVQSFDELGTPQSHGCIRQRRTDAIALWHFAPIGTQVVVTA